MKKKTDFCLCKNKDADQLCSNCTADQRPYFRYSDSTIPPLLLSKISIFYPASVTVQAGLFRAWSKGGSTFAHIFEKNLVHLRTQFSPGKRINLRTQFS